MGLKNLQKLAGITPTAPEQKTGGPNPFASAPTPDKPKGTMGFLGGMNKIGDFFQNAAKTIGGVGIGAAKSFVKLPQEAAAFGQEIGTRAVAAVKGVPYEQMKSAMARDQGVAGDISKGVERPEWTKAHGTAEKVGEVAGDIGQFFIPVGGAEKAVTKGAELLGGGAKAAESAGGIAKAAEKTPFIEKAVDFVGKSLKEGAEQAVRTGVQTGDTKSAGEAGIMGAATPTANAILGGLGKVGKQVVETMASKLSGVPKEAIEHAISNPDAVRSTMRAMAKDPAMGPQKVLDSATEAFDAMKDTRREAYRAGLKKVEEETMQTKGGQWYVKREITPEDIKNGIAPASELGKTNTFVPTDFSTKGVKNSVTRTLKDFGAEIKGAEVSMDRVALPKSYKNDLQEVVDKIYGWDDMSPTGLDDLRENIDVFKKSSLSPSTADKKFNKIIGDIRTNISKYVGKRVPQIEEMNKSYAAMSEPIERIAQELRLERNPVTAMRKLTNAFSPKSSVYRDLIKELGDQGAKDLLSDIAGLTMAKWTPEGLGAHIATLLGAEGAQTAFRNPAAIPGMVATAAMASPRIVGEAATAAGTVSKAIQPAMSTIRQAEKGVISQAARK